MIRTETIKDRAPLSADQLPRLRAAAEDPGIEQAVGAVREFLDMDVAYTTRITASAQIFEEVSGSGETFGIAPGMAMDIDDTYCQRVLNGRLPAIMPDVKGDPRAASLAITEAAGVGAFVSIPLRLSDGSVPGTLCAVSREARPDLGYRDLRFLQIFARLIADQIERRVLEKRQRDVELQAAAAATLIAAVAARDSYTAEHSRQVVGNAVAVADLLGLAEDEVSDVEKVALLHDIGKIGMPDEILRKPGPLNEAEWETMRRHPIISERLIGQIRGLEHLGPMLRAEHERWDGRGYPDGLRGEKIPIASRITFACDAYDAMTSDRPYRKGLPRETALEKIRGGSGTQFCPRVAAALLTVLDPA